MGCRSSSTRRIRSIAQASLFVGLSMAASMLVVCGIYSLAPVPGGASRRFTELDELEASEQLGRLATRMVDMVAEDLPFTIFVPVEEAFQDLELSCTRSAEETREGEDEESSKSQCLSAVISRVMSFSAVPRQIVSSQVSLGQEVEVESLSGDKLYLARDAKRGLVVNNHSVRASDLRFGQRVVHVIDGVLMDSMLERSMHLNQQ